MSLSKSAIVNPPEVSNGLAPLNSKSSKFTLSPLFIPLASPNINTSSVILCVLSFSFGITAFSIVYLLFLTAKYFKLLGVKSAPNILKGSYDVGFLILNAIDSILCALLLFNTTAVWKLL